MREHAWAQGVPFAWVTGDERYGGDPGLLAALEAEDVRSVMAVPATTRGWADGAPLAAAGPWVQTLHAATALPQSVAASGADWTPAVWQRLEGAAGAKGPRTRDWAAVRVVASREPWLGPALWRRARRAVSAPTELAYYLAHAPAETALATLAQVAASGWPVAPCFAEAKGETGLDPYAVRGWPSWHRHITLALLAHGFLAWQRRQAGETSRGVAARGRTDGLAPVRVPEVRRLLALTLALPARSVAFHLAWSVWRRQHQGEAKRQHYARAQRRTVPPPDS